MSPTFWREIGADSKVFYAAARLFAAGRNPYDSATITAEENVLYNQPRHLVPGKPGYYAPAVYGYPPALKPLLVLGAGAGEPAFYGASLLLLGAALVGATLLVLAAVGWQGRLLPVLFAVASTPAVLGLFVGNPSALIFLGVALALFLASRDRPLVAGVAATLSLVKLPIGGPLCLALLVALPARRGPLAAGMIGGAVAWVAAGLAAAGTRGTLDWVNGLGGYSSNLGAAGSSPYRQTDLAGLPALLLDRLGPVAATLLAVAVVAAGAWACLRRVDWAAALNSDPWAAPAAAIAAALVIAPYLHLNDLVVGLFPLLVVASHRPGPVTGATLFLFFALIPARLVAVALTAAPAGGVPSTAGVGVVLTVLTLVAALAVLRRAEAPVPARTRGAPRAASAPPGYPPT